MTATASPKRITRHRLTRLGLQLMLIGVFSMVGGALNGLNLLVAVAAIAIAALVMQWRISRSMIDDARIDRRLPGDWFAGKPVRVRYQVSNTHPLRPLWLLRIVDTLETNSGGGADPLKCTFTTGVGFLRGGQTTSTFADLTIAQRGRYRWDPWRVSTVAPLAMSTAWRDAIVGPQWIDVYPELLPLTRSWRRNLPSRVGNVSANAQRQGVADDVFFGLREYRRGDSPKHIHWRTTARLGTPAVRQFEQQRRLDLCLVVDAFVATGRESGTAGSSSESAAAASAGQASDVETAISLAATLAVELSGGMGALAVVGVAGRTADIVAGGGSVEGLRRVLKCLAVVQPGDDPPLDQTLRESLMTLTHRPDLIVISSRSKADAMATLDADESMLRQWQRRQSITWVDVSSRDAAAWIASDNTNANTNANTNDKSNAQEVAA